MNQRDPSYRRKSRRGAAAVEFAFAISILILIVFASIEFVRMNMLAHSINHASYLAARKGIIIGSKANDVVSEAETHLALFGVTNASVSVSPSPIKDDTQVVEVVIDVPMSGNTWIAPAYFNGTMTGKTRMLAERAAADMLTAVPAP